MRTGYLIAGIVLLFVGLWGLAGLYGYSKLLPATGYVVDELGMTGAAALFALVLIVGIVLLAKSPTSIGGAPVTSAEQRVSYIEMMILHYLAEGRRPGEISRVTGMSEVELNRNLDGLEERGYVTKDIRLTRKGYESLSWQERSVTTTAPPPPP